MTAPLKLRPNGAIQIYCWYLLWRSLFAT